MKIVSEKIRDDVQSRCILGNQTVKVYNRVWEIVRDRVWVEIGQALAHERDTNFGD